MTIQKCKTCKWWGEDSPGACGKISMGFAPNEAAFIEVDVDDDQGLSTSLKTSPHFGCTLHEPKTAKKRKDYHGIY